MDQAREAMLTERARVTIPYRMLTEEIEREWDKVLPATFSTIV
jgi:hypothetical protein